MGCSQSTQSIPLNPPTLYDSISPVVDNLTEDQKEKLIELIEGDQILKLTVYMDEIKALPESAITERNWMVIHLCCRWDSDKCLDYLLKDYFIRKSDKYIDFVNAPTKDGYTSLHICAMYKSEKCFQVLHGYGGLNLNAKDKSLKIPLESAASYKCKKMEEILSEYKKMNVHFTQIETKKLIESDFTDFTAAEESVSDNRRNSVYDGKQIINSNRNQDLGEISQMQRQMMEERRKLEEEKNLLFKQKMQAQKEVLQMKLKILEEQKKKQSQEIDRIKRERQVKEQMERESNRRNEALVKELQLKDKQLNRIRNQLNTKEEERIQRQKQKVQNKSNQFVRQREKEIERMALEKEQAISNLRKQQEQKRRLKQEEGKKKLKEVQLMYNKKLSDLAQVLQAKQSQIVALRQEREEKKRNERDRSVSDRNQQDFRKKLKEKEDEIERLKKQQIQKLNNERNESERKAKIYDTKQLEKSQNNISKNKQDNQSNGRYSELQQAFRKINQKVPQNITILYEEAKRNGSFTDPEFPPNNKSLGDFSKSDHFRAISNHVWLRPQAFIKNKIQVFDGIEPNDIKQGFLGVCYFLALLGSFAKDPKLIESFFVFTDTVLGFYVLRLYIHGKPKFIFIDDYVPCEKATKTPLFTRPNGNQIWVLLLQKVWAKAIGNYFSSQAMPSVDPMEDFTGVPTDTNFTDERDTKKLSAAEHIQILHEGIRLKRFLVLTAGKRKFKGLVNQHAYSLLQSYQYKGRSIFKVRNPWGNFEWNGEYGIKSSLWTPQLKKLVGYEQNDDGAFFVSENDLLKGYESYFLGYYIPNSSYEYYEFTSKKAQDIFFRVNVSKSSPVNFRVIQIFDRMLEDKSYEYSSIIFEVGRINSQDDVTFIAQGDDWSCWGFKSINAFKKVLQDLSAGEYFVRVNVHWKNERKYNSAVFAAYGPNKFAIQRISQEAGQRYLKALCYSYTQSKSGQSYIGAFYKYAFLKGEVIFVVQAEQEGEYDFLITFDLKKMRFLQLGLGKASNNQFRFKITKRRYGIGLLKRTDLREGGEIGPAAIKNYPI